MFERNHPLYVTVSCFFLSLLAQKLPQAKSLCPIKSVPSRRTVIFFVLCFLARILFPQLCKKRGHDATACIATYKIRLSHFRTSPGLPFYSVFSSVATKPLSYRC
eukprot:Rmarinus@m.19523